MHTHEIARLRRNGSIATIVAAVLAVALVVEAGDRGTGDLAAVGLVLGGDRGENRPVLEIDDPTWPIALMLLSPWESVNRRTNRSAPN